MSDFKHRFSPSSSSGLPSFLASSPHLESSGLPNLRDIIAEQTRTSSPPPTANSGHGGHGGQGGHGGDGSIVCVPQGSNSSGGHGAHGTPSTGHHSAKPAIIVDNRKFDLNSWLTNKSFLMLISFIAFISILIIGFILISKSRAKKNSVPDDENEVDNDRTRGRGAGAGAGASASGRVAGASASAGGGHGGLRTPRIESELSNHTNDIKFLMTQMAQLTSKIQQLEKAANT